MNWFARAMLEQWLAVGLTVIVLFLFVAGILWLGFKIF